MSDTSIAALLKDCGLLDKAEKVEDDMYRLRWGSAMVLVGISGKAIVAIAPLFQKLPAGKETAFCRRLLELNATMGGMAAFAIQADGWTVLHAGRGVKGLDADELAILVGTVGKFADDYDDILYDEFFAPPEASGESAGSSS